MTFYVTVIFEDPEKDEHGYRVNSISESLSCANGIWTIDYIDENSPDKKHIVTYNVSDVFSVLLDEE